ncbi:hypothetical protein PI124_g4753 [Phytophthora idaei]|nr:hypothetical protein PI125_g4422 [Phytophthora idaei]KAG3127946.1 hypothetical protein PI126_g21624 [Phytophthora idaei]KAG3250621.1 hypothetical protein PI124_g4753 [Phytophthora idaei]
MDVVEHGFPRPNAPWLAQNEVVERGFPHVVERELPEEVDAVESSIPYPDAILPVGVASQQT